MKKIKQIATVLICMLLFSCNQEPEIDIQRLQTLLEDTSSLSIEDDNEIFDITDKMLDKLQSMSDAERETFISTKEGEEFSAAFAGSILYIGIRFQNDGQSEGIRPLTSEQKAKCRTLIEKIEKIKLFDISDVDIH